MDSALLTEIKENEMNFNDFGYRASHSGLNLDLWALTQSEAYLPEAMMIRCKDFVLADRFATGLANGLSLEEMK